MCVCIPVRVSHMQLFSCYDPLRHDAPVNLVHVLLDHYHNRLRHYEPGYLGDGAGVCSSLGAARR